MNALRIVLWFCLLTTTIFLAACLDEETKNISDKDAEEETTLDGDVNDEATVDGDADDKEDDTLELAEEDSEIEGGEIVEAEIEGETPYDPSPPFEGEGICTSLLLGNQTHTLQTNHSTHFHLAAHFDGQALWLTYTTIDETRHYDVYATKLNCDFTEALEPFLLNETSHDELDSAIAQSGDALMFTWLKQQSESERNLDIHYRAYNRSGEALTPDTRLALLREGNDLDVNAWMPSIAGLGDGFAVVGSFADPNAERWQGFLAKLSAQGEAADDLLNLNAAPLTTQLEPTISSGVGERAWVAFAATEDEAEEAVRWAFVGEEAISTPAAAKPNITSQKAALSNAVADKKQVFLAFTASAAGETDVIMQALDETEAIGTTYTLGALGEIDHTPAIAAESNGEGRIAWYRTIQGFKNELFVQAFHFDSATGEFTLEGDALKINETPAAPYPLAFIHIRDDIYFAAWSEGDSPYFSLKMRFIRQ